MQKEKGDFFINRATGMYEIYSQRLLNMLKRRSERTHKVNRFDFRTDNLPEGALSAIVLTPTSTYNLIRWVY